MCKWSSILSILALYTKLHYVSIRAKNINENWYKYLKRGLHVGNRTVGIVQYNVARKYCVGTLPDINSIYRASFFIYKSLIHRIFMHIHILSQTKLSLNLSWFLPSFHVVARFYPSLSLSYFFLLQVNKISHSGHFSVQNEFILGA